MGQDRRSARALAALLPAGALGLSVSLASADAAATLSSDSSAKAKQPGNVAERLQSIRASVSDAVLVGQWRVAQRRMAQRRLAQLGQRRLAQLGQWLAQRLAELVSRCPKNPAGPRSAW